MERPILFSEPMVRAILDGQKTMTRRVVKNLDYIQDWDSNDPTYGPFFEDEYGDSHKTVDVCPYGSPCDHIWVRETWLTDRIFDSFTPKDIPKSAPIEYTATDIPFHTGKTRPSIFMCRWMSRITLEITDVRVERLQEITEEDALLEGIERSSWEYSCEPYRNYNHPRTAPGHNCSTARMSFCTLWNSINEKTNPWASNPWVWVIKFKRVEVAK